MQQRTLRRSAFRVPPFPRGSVPAGAGIALGIVLSVAAGRMMSAGFPGTQNGMADLGTSAVVLPVVIAVVVLAAYVPARRAARIDPLAALRQE